MHKRPLTTAVRGRFRILRALLKEVMALGSEMKITSHGSRRVRERCGLPKSNVYNFVRCAYKNGLMARNTNDDLRRYIDGLFYKNCTRHGNRQDIVFKIYHGSTFVFSAGHRPTLLTVFPLPEEVALSLQD